MAGRLPRGKSDIYSGCEVSPLWPAELDVILPIASRPVIDEGTLLSVTGQNQRVTY